MHWCPLLRSTSPVLLTAAPRWFNYLQLQVDPTCRCRPTASSASPPHALTCTELHFSISLFSAVVLAKPFNQRFLHVLSSDVGITHRGPKGGRGNMLTVFFKARSHQMTSYMTLDLHIKASPAPPPPLSGGAGCTANGSSVIIRRTGSDMKQNKSALAARICHEI